MSNNRSAGVGTSVGDRVRSYGFPDLPGMKTTC